ncbi:DUF4365 domain-containing protein [Floridanema aerugineum]|uniref:DUF4365 domain-containing protein n=1 Tax=Floridaenema aerugineum BLCC-F46 TaxID=3153654 RepID=A0ABV4X2D0_9CYAN
MDKNSQKEEFSYGYIHLLASVCGYIFDTATRAKDNNLGIDVEIIDSVSTLDNEAARFFIQAKCTTPEYFIEEGDFYKYDLKVTSYKQLIRKTLDPLILVILVVPKEIEDWITIDEENGETIIRKCAYWISLKGKEPTNKTGTIRIKIPKENLFTPTAMRNIMKASIDYREKLFGLDEQYG